MSLNVVYKKGELNLKTYELKMKIYERYIYIFICVCIYTNMYIYVHIHTMIPFCTLSRYVAYIGVYIHKI